MSIAAILAVFLQAPLPMDYNFEALTLHVPQLPEAPVVKGMETTWTRTYVKALPNAGRVGGRYDVKIVDHSQDKVEPTEAAVLYDLELAARGDRMPLPKARDWAITPTLRTSMAYLGTHRLMVLVGTQLHLTKSNQEYVEYVAWCGFYANKKAYYYRFASTEFAELNASLAAIRSMKYGPAEEPLIVEGFPEGFAGEYYVINVPFLLTADDLPVVVANHQPLPFDPEDTDVPTVKMDLRYIARIGGLAGYRMIVTTLTHVIRETGAGTQAHARFDGLNSDGEVLDSLLWEGGPRRSRLVSVYRQITSTSSLRLAVDEKGETVTYSVRYLRIGLLAAALVGPDGGDGRTTMTPIRLDKNGLRL